MGEREKFLVKINPIQKTVKGQSKPNFKIMQILEILREGRINEWQGAELNSQKKIKKYKSEKISAGSTHQCYQSISRYAKILNNKKNEYLYQY